MKKSKLDCVNFGGLAGDGGQGHLVNVMYQSEMEDVHTGDHGDASLSSLSGQCRTKSSQQPGVGSGYYHYSSLDIFKDDHLNNIYNSHSLPVN